MELNDRQRAVVAAPIDRPTKVVAGAGTGKTRVLVERYLRFLHDGVPPSRLLALTFTLKAADEMRQRIFEQVEQQHPELLRELYVAWIMNFHAFGFRIIRENAPAFGIDPGVDVASEAQLRRIDRVLEARFMGGRIEGVPRDFGGTIPPPAGLRSWFEVVLGAVKKCRGDMIPVENLAEAIRDDDAGQYKAAVASISAVHDELVREMDRQGLIDFNDMIGVAVRGLSRDPQLARHYREKFDHILVDEFQDTSAAQFELLKVLTDDAYSKVTVVGDEKQSIYRWRDARVENIRDFPGKRLPLSQNYRSRQNILDVAHGFITRDADLAARAVRLEADRQERGVPVVLFHPGDQYEGQQNDMEADALAAWVVHVTGGAPVAGVPPLVGSGVGADPVGYGDVAVLLRGIREYRVVPAVERAFTRAGIPHVILGGADAAGSRALALLHSYLALLSPGDRRMDLLHVLESRPFDVGHASLVELFGDQGEAPGDRHTLLSDDRVGGVSDAGARERLFQLRACLDGLDRSHAGTDFRSFLSGALEDTPFLLRVFEEGATMRSVEDLVGELFETCDSLEARGELGLWAFLDSLRAAIDRRSFGRVEPLAVPPGHVRVMTIHQAKGLEFPAVAVAGIKPPQNDASGFFLSRSHGVFSEKWKDWNRGYKGAPEREAEKEMQLREERCLLYVAMTRARDLLFVSSPYANHPKSFFGDVLAAAVGVEPPSVVIRYVPPGPRAVERHGAEPEPGTGDAAAVTTEWRETRELLAAQVAAAPTSTDPVHFVSWAALRTFADCPLQYRYRYLLRVGDALEKRELNGDDRPREEDGDLDSIRIPRGVTPAEYGIVVHELLRELMGARAAGQEPPRGWIEAAVGRAGVGANLRSGVVASASEILAAFDAAELGVPGREMRLEEPFQVRVDRAVFHGVFDRVERSPQGWLVTDYKLGRERDDYAFQVRFYAWALGRIAGDAAGRLCYLRGDGVKFVAVPADGLDALAGELDRQLRDGEFRASPGAACAACAYSTTCPSAVRG
jgi:DNA helicase-2/ATP-dependent DNA helicase PcrA